MTQEEKWNLRYLEVKGFIESNKRNVSKYNLDERQLYTWVKHQRKVMNAGELKPEREEKFRKLLEMTERYKRKNQYR